MEPDFSRYLLEGDNSMYAAGSGLVVPVVTRGGHESGQTGQSGGASCSAGVSPQHTPATKIWFGKVSDSPACRSVPHHHGEAETGGYVLSGRARGYFGERFADYLDMEEGDWVFVPPFMPHIECNLDRIKPLTWMTARTPENIVVNLPQVCLTTGCFTPKRRSRPATGAASPAGASSPLTAPTLPPSRRKA